MRTLEIREVDDAARSTREPANARAPFALERLGDARDRRVLEAAREEPGAPSPPKADRTRDVVRLGAAGGEQDVARVGRASAATAARASSTTARAARPSPWMLDGLPHVRAPTSRIASSTSGSGGVVAFQSR